MAAQRFQRGDTIAYEVRYAPNVPPKRTLGEVLDVGAHGARVRLGSGEELWLRNSQIKIVATEAMARAEGERRESEKAASRKATEMAKQKGTESVTTEGRDVPANDVAPAVATTTGTIAAMRAAGQDPFAIFLAMARGLIDHQREEVARADAAIATAASQVDAARALLADAEKELERARLAAAEARGRLAQVERAASFAA